MKRSRSRGPTKGRDGFFNLVLVTTVVVHLSIATAPCDIDVIAELKKLIDNNYLLGSMATMNVKGGPTLGKGGHMPPYYFLML
jgi:hypothetical protein